MLNLTKWIAAPVLAAGLMVAADMPTAKAQFGYIGGVGHGHHIGRVPHGIDSGHRGYFPSYRYSARYRYGHGWCPPYSPRRGHYDWHPTQLVPHGNHLDLYPGHWHYHRGHH